jgi:hypothetical protein
MPVRRDRLLLLPLALALTCALPASAWAVGLSDSHVSQLGQGAAKKSATDSGKTNGGKKRDAKTAPTKWPSIGPAIVFYLAQGEPHACGPGCSEWIAAEGAIDAGAAQRLQALLDRLGARKLPIYFHSPGGSVDDAFAIGKLLRARKMTAGVALTVPQGCSAGAPDPACTAQKRSGRVLVAELDTARGGCMSACAYAMFGAAVREVPAGARLGVHSSRIVVRVRSERPVPADHPVLRRLMRERQQAGEVRRAAYVQAMGVDKGLLDVISRTPNDRMHFLSRDEIARYRIDTRDVVERAWTVEFDARRDSAWWTLSSSWPAFAAVKLLYDARDHSGYRAAFLSFACASKDQVAVTFGRERTGSDVAPGRPIRAVTGGGEFDFGAEVSNVVDASMRAFAVRRARVPIALMEAAATGGTIEITEAADLAAALPPRVTTLSTAGLARTLAALPHGCTDRSSVPTQ